MKDHLIIMYSEYHYVEIIFFMTSTLKIVNSLYDNNKQLFNTIKTTEALESDMCDVTKNV